MTAKDPEEICHLFKAALRAGDVAAAAALYDPEAVFLDQERQTVTTPENLKKVLGSLAAGRPLCDYTIAQIVQAGSIALMHTLWTMAPGAKPMHAVEVARRQSDGSWRWLIGDPFSIGRINLAQSSPPTQ